MKNKNDVRNEFYDMAYQIYGEDYALRLMGEYDNIMGDKVETFSLAPFPEMYYVIAPRDNGQWVWFFEEPGESVEFGGTFQSRMEAMLDAARDADNTVFADDTIGDRIRKAI